MKTTVKQHWQYSIKMTVSTSSMAPSAFSQDGKYYSQIGNDGKCKVWETETGVLKQEFSPDLHLSAPLSCLNWVQLDGGTSNPKWKSRKRKSSRADDEVVENSKTTDCIVFGTTSGKILLYSLSHAKVESVLEDSSHNEGDPEISCMEWSRQNGLYTCSVDSTIREWKIEDGNVRSKFRMNKLDKQTQNSNKTTAIRVITHQPAGGQAHKILITASCQLRVWSLESHTVLRRMVGHAGDVAHLYTVPILKDDRFYILSGSKSDRILSFWSINLTSEDLSGSSNHNDSLQEYKKTKRRSKNKSSSEDNGSQEVVEACCNFLMEDSAKQVSCTVQDPDASSLISVAAVTRRGVVHYYHHTLDGLSIKPIKPSTTIQVVSEDEGSVKLSPALCGTIAKDHLLIGYSTSRGMVFERIIPDVSEKTQVLIRSTSAKEMTKKEKVQQKNEDITRIRKGEGDGTVYLSTHVGEGKAHSRGGNKVDVPMELRLANLSIEQANKQSTEPTNMAQLLVQALHSKDSKLLQTVFECTDPAVAQSTLNRLPIQYLPTLLEHLTIMMAKRTNQCKSACVWSAALCKARGSVLLGQEQSVRPLVAALKARAPHLPHLLALKGRLSLLTNRQDTEQEYKPVLEYKDSSSEDEGNDDDMDGLMNAGADDSAVSWNEDEDEEENEDESDQENMSE